MNSSGSPRCDYIFVVNDTSGNLAANDIWIAFGKSPEDGGVASGMEVESRKRDCDLEPECRWS